MTTATVSSVTLSRQRAQAILWPTLVLVYLLLILAASPFIPNLFTLVQDGQSLAGLAIWGAAILPLIAVYGAHDTHRGSMFTGPLLNWNPFPTEQRRTHYVRLLLCQCLAGAGTVLLLLSHFFALAAVAAMAVGMFYAFCLSRLHL